MILQPFHAADTCTFKPLFKICVEDIDYGLLKL